MAGLQVQAQFTQAEVSVNGLTCSQCSRSVEMALKRLDFISKVEMDLQQPTAHIVFKKNKAIDFEKLAVAVRDAGFNVRAIKASYKQEKAMEDVCFTSGRQLYYSVNSKSAKQGDLKLLLLGKGMISDTELKKYQANDWVKAPECPTTLSNRVPYLILNP